jgi:hypothetical protein
MDRRAWIKRVVVCAAGSASSWLVGCASSPPLDNPIKVRAGDIENPILVAPGQPSASDAARLYTEVYDRVLDALDDYFPIKPSSRHSGVIETEPQVAAGFEQFWKPGTPDNRQRLLATFQSIRHTAVARIEPGEQGGFRVYIEVFKELEDLSRPILQASTNPIFRDSPTVDRSAQVITGPRATEAQWIPAGPAPHRDYEFEQAILWKIRKAGGLK